MAGKNNDWTDELRDLIDGVELTPSEGGWDRLKADLHPRRAAWWPYAVPAAACLLIGGVFLFRGQPSGNVLDVVAEPVSPAAMVAENARVESEPSLQPEAADPLFSQRDILAASDENAHDTTTGSTTSGSMTAVNGDTGSLTVAEGSETVPAPPAPVYPPAPPRGISREAAATEEGGPLAVGSAEQTSSDPSVTAETVPDRPGLVVEEEPALPSLAVQAPAFDFEEEPIARQRKQRRKITVTVSAGGAFGSAGNGIYFAQAAPAGPVTKAGAGRVMDITEVIQHSTPKQTALALSIPVSDRMDIGTGIDHMELNSVVGFGSQNLEWVGVPLRLGYNVASWGPSSLNVGAGFKGEKCLSATLLGMDFTEPFQWSANMGADFRLRMFGPVSFSISPEISYYFTDTVLPTYRTGHPLTFTLHAGLSLNL